VQRRLDYYARRAGLEDVTPHALRHTFAKNLVDAGRPLTEVAALLGHARLNTTAVYTQPGQADLRQAVEAVDWGEE
jgi:integrase/recombinase XerD